MFLFTQFQSIYSGTANVEIVCTFFKDHENDLLTQTNFLLPSLKFHQGLLHII